MGVAPSHLGLLSKFAARRSLGESNLDQRAAKSRSPNGEWSSTLPSPRRSTQLIHATRSHQYRYLSTRLVTQKGIQLMGLAAFGILIVTGGRVALRVVLYSINVFLT